MLLWHPPLHAERCAVQWIQQYVERRPQSICSKQNGIVWEATGHKISPLASWQVRLWRIDPWCHRSKLSNIAHCSDLTWLHLFTLRLCLPKQRWDTRREGAKGDILSLSGKELLISSGHLMDTFSLPLTHLILSLHIQQQHPGVRKTKPDPKHASSSALCCFGTGQETPFIGQETPFTGHQGLLISTSLCNLNSFMTAMDGKRNDLSEKQV